MNSDSADRGLLWAYTLKNVLLFFSFSASKPFLNVKVISGSSSTIKILLVNGDSCSSVTDWLFCKLILVGEWLFAIWLSLIVRYHLLICHSYDIQENHSPIAIWL